MNPQLKSLKKIREQLVQKARKRDDLALSKPDKWYKSQKGINHESATEHLSDAVEGLDKTIMELENYIHEAS